MQKLRFLKEILVYTNILTCIKILRFDDDNKIFSK